MRKALGMIEFKTVASGITATDVMLKTADIEIISAGAVCPGKYISVISGEISSVKSAIEAAEKYNAPMLIDKFLLGNPHETVCPAICGTLEVKSRGAVGIIETYTAAAAVVAADTAVKTAAVELVEIRLAKGMCGKSYVILTGSVSAVSAAVDKAKLGLDGGLLLDASVISRPDERLWESIL